MLRCSILMPRPGMAQSSPLPECSAWPTHIRRRIPSSYGDTSVGFTFLVQHVAMQGWSSSTGLLFRSSTTHWCFDRDACFAAAGTAVETYWLGGYRVSDSDHKIRSASWWDTHKERTHHISRHGVANIMAMFFFPGKYHRNGFGEFQLQTIEWHESEYIFFKAFALILMSWGEWL